MVVGSKLPLAIAAAIDGGISLILVKEKELKILCSLTSQRYHKILSSEAVKQGSTLRTS